MSLFALSLHFELRFRLFFFCFVCVCFCISHVFIKCLTSHRTEKMYRRCAVCREFTVCAQEILPRCIECRRSLAMRILSVRLSVKLVICDKMTESCVRILIAHERPLTLVLWQEEWLGCQLHHVHIAHAPIQQHRKSHTGFRLIPTSMTLNDLERRGSPYFAFFSPNSIALLANYVTVVEDRPIMSIKYCLPVPVFHFGHN